MQGSICLLTVSTERSLHFLGGEHWQSFAHYMVHPNPVRELIPYLHDGLIFLEI